MVKLPRFFNAGPGADVWRLDCGLDGLVGKGGNAVGKESSLPLFECVNGVVGSWSDEVLGKRVKLGGFRGAPVGAGDVVGRLSE
jgi:hypothetical protein